MKGFVFVTRMPTTPDPPWTMGTSCFSGSAFKSAQKGFRHAIRAPCSFRRVPASQHTPSDPRRYLTSAACPIPGDQRARRPRVQHARRRGSRDADLAACPWQARALGRRGGVVRVYAPAGRRRARGGAALATFLLLEPVPVEPPRDLRAERAPGLRRSVL